MNNHLEIISLINSKMALNVKPKGNLKKTGYTKHSQPVLYSQILITKTIPISINNIGNSIKATLEKAVAMQIEGKCIVEGYIKPGTIEIITFSSGLVTGSYVIFEVVFQCYVCSPVEGMLINCVAKHINKAGIRAEVNEMPSPVVIFIARDHNYASPLFSQVKEDDEIKIRVIGQRFELNDKYISIIAELVENANVNVPLGRTIIKKKNKPITLHANVENAQALAAPVQALAAPVQALNQQIETELEKEIVEDLLAEQAVPAPAPAPAPVEKATNIVSKKVTKLKIRKPTVKMA